MGVCFKDFIVVFPINIYLFFKDESMPQSEMGMFESFCEAGSKKKKNSRHFPSKRYQFSFLQMAVFLSSKYIEVNDCI